MESAILGLILDTSVLIAAERNRLTALQAIESVLSVVGDVPIALSVMTLAEIGHGVHRAADPEIRRRRLAFLEDLRATIPSYAVTEKTADLIARIGAEQAAKGAVLPVADLIIASTALQLRYAVGTSNTRDFGRVPGLEVVRL